MNGALYGITAFLAGAVVAVINYFITKKKESKNGEIKGIYTSALVRQIINIAFLIGLYFISKLSEENMFVILLCGVLGITVPMTVLTVVLLKNKK